MEKFVPYFYFPTTTLFVDDDSDFLKLIAYKAPAGSMVLSETLSEKALKTIQESHGEYNAITENFHKEINSNEVGQEATFSFRRVTSNRKRHDLISVVIVDYSMPGFSGIDICKSINDLPMKKVLLTGEADHKFGVKSLNDGIIDRFVVKDNEEITSSLFKYILELKKCYFVEASKKISKKLYSWQNSLVIKNLFENFILKFNIVEYYLLNTSGSYVGYAKNGSTFFFIIQSESEIRELVDIAVDNEADESILQGLENRSTVLFFPEESDVHEPVSEWGRFVYPCNQIKAEDETYYYTFVEN